MASTTQLGWKLVLCHWAQHLELQFPQGEGTRKSKGGGSEDREEHRKVGWLVNGKESRKKGEATGAFKGERGFQVTRCVL